MPFNIMIITDSFNFDCKIQDVGIFQSSSQDAEEAKKTIADQIAKRFFMVNKEYDPHSEGICLNCFVDGKDIPNKDLGVDDDFDEEEFIDYLIGCGINVNCEYAMVSVHKDNNPSTEHHFRHFGGDSEEELKETIKEYYKHKKEKEKMESTAV